MTGPDTEPTKGLVEAVWLSVARTRVRGHGHRPVVEATIPHVLAYLNAHPAEAAALLPAVERWARLDGPWRATTPEAAPTEEDRP